MTCFSQSCRHCRANWQSCSSIPRACKRISRDRPRTALNLKQKLDQHATGAKQKRLGQDHRDVTPSLRLAQRVSSHHPFHCRNCSCTTVTLPVHTQNSFQLKKWELLTDRATYRGCTDYDSVTDALSSARILWTLQQVTAGEFKTAIVTDGVDVIVKLAAPAI